MSRTVSDNTSLLRLLPEGKYVGRGNYAFSENANKRLGLESSFTLSHTEILLVLEGVFSLPTARAWTSSWSSSCPGTMPGKGYFVFHYEPLKEIVGVLGMWTAGATCSRGGQ